MHNLFLEDFSIDDIIPNRHRYFGGDVKLETVSTVAVSANSDVGKLSAVPKGCEVDVPMEFRINRATNSHWKFESGIESKIIVFALHH